MKKQDFILILIVMVIIITYAFIVAFKDNEPTKPTYSAPIKEQNAPDGTKFYVLYKSNGEPVGFIKK